MHRVALLLYVAITRLNALAPTRRAALRSAVGALGLTTAQRAAAATNAEAEKVRVASRELNELLRNEDALRFKVLVEGSGTDSASFASPPPARHRCDATHDAVHAGKLPIAVSFITFQKLEKDCGDDFMGMAIEYAETYKDAKDLVKLVRRAASSLFEVCVVATASVATPRRHRRVSSMA